MKIKQSTQISLTCLILFLVIGYGSNISTAFLVVPIYMIWLTVHSIERKLNALLDEKGIFVSDD